MSDDNITRLGRNSEGRKPREDDLTMVPATLVRRVVEELSQFATLRDRAHRRRDKLVLAGWGRNIECEIDNFPAGVWEGGGTWTSADVCPSTNLA
jgi:hypothetical protein